VIFAGVNGFLDKVPVNQVTKFEQGLLDELRSKGSDLLATIREEKQLTSETEEKLKSFIGDYAKVFVG
jgi:F-type H+-transporting ATPase subunit alpha